MVFEMLFLNSKTFGLNYHLLPLVVVHAFVSSLKSVFDAKNVED